MKTKSIKPLATAICTGFLATALGQTAGATGNPFAADLLDSGYQLAAAEKADEGKCGEGKCGGEKKAVGEGKCGEGKCGG